MSLIAEFELSNPILADLRRQFPELEYRIVDEFVSADGAPMLTAWAVGEESSLERLHGMIPDDATVVDASLLADLGTRRLYRLELTPEGAVGMTYPRAVEEGITFLDIRASNDSVHYRARIPDRESFMTFRQLCADRDLDFKLRGLYRGESEERTTTRLTDRQREVLRAAFEAGYFAVPRQTTLESLATELDISDQALSATIRRGQANLLAETIATDLTPDDPSDGS